MSDSIEIAICETDNYDYDDYNEKLSGVISEWTEVTKEEYDALIALSRASRCPHWTVVVKVPVTSKTLKTVRDYVKEANEYIKSLEEVRKQALARELKRKQVAEKKKTEKELKNIEKLRAKLAELEKLKSGGK